MAIKLTDSFPQENTDKFTLTFTNAEDEALIDQEEIYIRVMWVDDNTAVPDSEFGDYNYLTNEPGVGNDAILDGDVSPVSTGVYDFIYTLPNITDSSRQIRIEVRAFRTDPNPPNEEIKTYQSLQMKLVL
jgi:hypothetical protein